MEKVHDYKHMLLELLAVIHGDGGHYVGEHGVEKAAQDAATEVLRRKRDQDLPPDETPVVILLRNGDVRLGELRWDHPGYEDCYDSYRYWDGPYNDGQDWAWQDVMAWAPIHNVCKFNKVGNYNDL